GRRLHPKVSLALVVNGAAPRGARGPVENALEDTGWRISGRGADRKTNNERCREGSGDCYALQCFPPCSGYRVAQGKRARGSTDVGSMTAVVQISSLGN